MAKRVNDPELNAADRNDPILAMQPELSMSDKNRLARAILAIERAPKDESGSPQCPGCQAFVLNVTEHAGRCEPLRELVKDETPTKKIPVGYINAAPSPSDSANMITHLTRIMLDEVKPHRRAAMRAFVQSVVELAVYLGAQPNAITLKETVLRETDKLS